MANSFYGDGFYSPVVLTSMEKILMKIHARLSMLGGNTILRFLLHLYTRRMALHTALCEKDLRAAFQWCVCDTVIFHRKFWEFTDVNPSERRNIGTKLLYLMWNQKIRWWQIFWKWKTINRKNIVSQLFQKAGVNYWFGLCI